MSTITAPSREYTVDQLDAMSNAKQYELVDGQLEARTVSGLSSYVGCKAARLLMNHCERLNLGYVFGADYGYACFSDPKTLRRPDVSCILAERFSPEQLKTGYATIPPDLAVEVLSPNDLAHKIEHKINEYLQAGVRLIWVINPILQSVYIYRLDGTTTYMHAKDDLSGEDVIPGFQCRVHELFDIGAKKPLDV